MASLAKTIAMSKLIFLSLIYLTSACDLRPGHPSFNAVEKQNDYTMVMEIPLPKGYKRIDQDSGSFGEWLRHVHLKKDKRVYLYNGDLKTDQSVQFAVIDMPVGKKDLQQCADAVMRLRAEYLFSEKKYDEISFSDNAGKKYLWQGGNDRKGFDRYLETVFGWCGSASLEKQMNLVKNLQQLQAGDVFVKGGFPGHAMIVMDVAIDDDGKKIYMLAQGFMPAQDIHIVKNPLHEELSPWYEINDAKEIITPEYVFYRNQLRSW